MARLPGLAQRIVAFDVRLRLGGEGQSIRRLPGWWVDRLAVDQPVQQVQNMRLRRRASLESQFGGSEHGLLVMLETRAKISTISRSPPGVLSMRCCSVRKAEREFGDERAAAECALPFAAMEEHRPPWRGPSAPSLVVAFALPLAVI